MTGTDEVTLHELILLHGHRLANKAYWECACGSSGFTTKPTHPQHEPLEDTLVRALGNFRAHVKRKTKA